MSPSFFERLTGLSQTDDQPTEPQQPVPTTAPAPAPTPAPEPSPTAPPPSEPPSAPTTPVVQHYPAQTTVQPVVTAKKEDWVQEPEGQLTIDVYQTPADIIIKSTIAGVTHDNLDITITNDMITIKGKRERDDSIRDEDYYYQECYWGAFSRSVILPVDIKADESEAILKNGILSIRLPKAEREKRKRIEVKTL
ncbi:Hsp20/alpha crystallin family protein [Candidatus Parcubacteria bacterium]|nr:Hsp20/alpha crystallin family protein [Candidatus Parcubacteria bacterium]